MTLKILEVRTVRTTPRELCLYFQQLAVRLTSPL